MILPDVNVLVYALRTDALHHAVSYSWLGSVINGDAAFGISPLTLTAVVRITTNPRSYAAPSTVDEVFRFSDFLLNQPHCQIVEPGERHWPLFRRLCIETNTIGPRVTDAWYAALAIEWGCEWITFDRDYARFPGLKWQTPGAA
jgi:uncharacterized protein